MLIATYWASLVVVIGTAIVVALHPDIPGGFIGTFWLGGIAMFGLAGFAFTPPTWLVGFMACLAGACIWGGTRWVHCRSPYLQARKMADALRHHN